MRFAIGITLAATLLSGIAPAARAGRKPRKAKTTKAVAALTPAQVNKSSRVPVGPGASGPAVLRAQILLDRAHFSPGELDAAYGESTKRAIEEFQKAHNFRVSGVIDKAVWDSLEKDTAPVLQPYKITAGDVTGPFKPVPEDMLARAKMPHLGYQSAEEALGEKFHISPAVLVKLNGRKRLNRAGVKIMAPNVERAELSKQAARIEIVKDKSILKAIARDGSEIAVYPISYGSDQHDPLPLGNWKVTGVLRNPKFYYNPDLFWDADPTHSKAVVAPGPNNPVGSVWIDLSKEHYGIHGTPEPALVGKRSTHGCIHLTNWDAEELARIVKPGVPVIMEEKEGVARRLNAELVPPLDRFPGEAGDILNHLAPPLPGLKVAAIRDSFAEGRSQGRIHEASDILAPMRTPVMAVTDGPVRRLYFSKLGGITVYQYDPSGTYCFYYAHLDGYAEGLQEGQVLKRGEVIGYVGVTGNAPPQTPHLHFAIYRLGAEKSWSRNLTAVNPYQYLLRAVNTTPTD